MKSPNVDRELARSPLMLIDDNSDNLHLLEHILEWAGFVNVKSFKNAQQAFESLPSFNPHLIVLDLRMPGMDGLTFLEKARAIYRVPSFLPILIFTADLSPETKIRALEGGASDFLTKPGDPVEIKLRINQFLATRKMQGELQNHNKILEAKVEERTHHLLIARREAVDLLGRAAEYRDDNTGKHAKRVGNLSANIAAALGENSEFIEGIRMAAPLHDVGKIAIPDSILNKPGSLTTEETLVMRRHVAIGGALIGENSSPLLQLAKEIALYHHERWDGRGYDLGLSEENIPLSARIVSVADAYDAMTSDRPYRKGMPSWEAMRELLAMSGSQFDPRVVLALKVCLRNSGLLNLEAA